MTAAGGTLSTVVAVDRTRTEAGLQDPATPSSEDIAARARQLMAESGGRLSTPAAVDKARAEAAARKPVGLADALEAMSGAADKLDAGIASAMESHLLDAARNAIAEARRKLDDGLPLDAGERAGARYPPIDTR